MANPRQMVRIISCREPDAPLDCCAFKDYVGMVGEFVRRLEGHQSVIIFDSARTSRKYPGRDTLKAIQTIPNSHFVFTERDK